MTHPGELLSAFLDGELLPGEHRRLSAHLDTCGACRGELDDLAVARAAVRGLPLLDLPGDLAPAAEGVVPLRRRPVAWAGAAAAALLVAIVGASVLTAPEPVSFDATELQTVFVTRSAVDDSFTPSKVVVAPVDAPRGAR